MPRTLLLADDSITIQKVVAITFAAEDFTVVTVDNGEDAFARARELRPAIIIADVAMPRRNGYELSHAIKSDPELRGIPVLLLSGTFEPLDPAKAAAAQANGHLVKPFDSQALIDKVNELLGGAPAQAPAVQAPVPLPAPAPAAARPATAPQPFAAAAPRPPQPGPPAGGPPQRPVPLTPQARPPTSPFGVPAAVPMKPAAAAPMPPAPARAPLPLTSPFQSAPSAAPARPEAGAPMPPQPVRPFAPPSAPSPFPPASPFPSAAQPRPAAPAPAPVPAPFARPAAIPVRPSSGFVPVAPSQLPPAQPPSPSPSPATNLWGAPVPARASPSVPAPPSALPPSFAPPPAPPPASARVPIPAPVPMPAPVPRVPSPERRPSLTPNWNEPPLAAPGREPDGFQAQHPQTQPMPVFPSTPPAFLAASEVSGMAEAAAAASVQPSLADLSLDVAMEEEPAELLPEIDGFELGGSQNLDVSLTGSESAFVSGELSDFSQQGGLAPMEGLDFDDLGSASQPLELASPHEFLDGSRPAAQSSAAPTARAPAPLPAPPLFDPLPAAAPPPAASADGESALRLALSQASREVIERVVWEVVPQLAEVILREHIERMDRERLQQ